MRGLVKLIICLICLASTTSLARQSSQLEKIKSQIKSVRILQKSTLYLALHQRCLRYFLPLDKNPIKTGFECDREAKAFLLSLNIDVVELADPRDGTKGFTTIVFKNELLELLNQTRMYGVLTEIQSYLQMASVIKFNLYNDVLKILKNDRTTIQFLGVLFQDSTAGAAHVAYLEKLAKQNHKKTQSRLFKENFRILNSTLSAFRELQEQKRWKRDYLLYPPFIEKGDLRVSSTQYHFYVISWNSKKMLENSVKKNAGKIFFMNTIFNYLYERFQNLQLQDLLSDKKPLSAKATQDVMLGLLGSLHGLGISPSDLELTNSINPNPQKFFSSVIKSLMEN